VEFKIKTLEGTMTSWQEKREQQRIARERKREQIEQQKEEAAKKRYRAATRHARKAQLNDPVVEDNQLLNRLLDQWEEKEYGN
jgi:hypothetical protein